MKIPLSVLTMLCALWLSPASADEPLGSSLDGLLNYAREHWTHPHENPPVGLILCSEKDTAVAHYALGNLANQVLAREYHLNLPGEAEVAARIETVRRLLLRSPARLASPPAE